MATLGFKDNDGLDVGNKYVTKEYLIDRYPNINTHSNMPSLWTWGLNSGGSFGDNTTATSRSSPGTTANGASNWKTVACATSTGDIFAGIRQDGTLWTWGWSTTGALGANATVSRSSPATTAGTNLTTWVRVSASAAAVAAIQNNGSLWTWGRGAYGRLGSNATANRSSPLTTAGAPAAGASDTWLHVSVGGNMMCGIKTDGVLYSWGRNDVGQLGNGTTTNRSSPASAVASTVINNWNSIACGYAHSAGITSDGRLWTWGWGDSGALGSGSTTNRSSPQTTTLAGTDWKLVACGDRFTAAIKSNGSLWTWGSNVLGQLGDGTTTNRSSPQTVAGGGLNWVRITASADFGGSNAGGIKSDGSLWTWGSNLWGQLGDGTTTDRSSPVTVVGGYNSWKVLAITGNVMGAIKEEDDF
jgi:alpha-tubulin suppressor-like RCC1 family protein